MIAKRILKTEALKLAASVHIGKFGVTEGVIKEVRKQLVARKIIKIKFLKSFMGEKNKTEVAQELALKTNSEVLHRVGFTLVLYRK